MSRQPVTRDDLPYLEVESVNEGPVIPAKDDRPEYHTWHIRGTVSDPSIVDTSFWCTLLGKDRNCLYGDWRVKPGPDRKVEFETAFDHPTTISAGDHLAFAGIHHGWAAILIEDGPNAWEECTFSARNAIATRFVGTDGQSYRKLVEQKEGEPIEPDAELIVEGWDHEHCLLCNDHIDPGDRFYRHKSERGQFLCVNCYEEHAMTGDLSFLLPR
jgi:hypothetical protein